MISEVRELFAGDKPLRNVWQQLMLYEGSDTPGYEDVTSRCLDRIGREDIFSGFRKAIANGQDPNDAISQYLFGEPKVFDGTGIETDYERDFMQSEPYFFVRDGNPNCLGRPIVIASTYPRDSLKLMEVLRTNKLNQNFYNLQKANRDLDDGRVYLSEDADGRPVFITGRDAKASILEGILYDEKPHTTVLRGEKILDPVEAPFGKPIGIEYPIIRGISAHTFTNMCAFFGLYLNDGNRNEEADALLRDMLGLCPKSVFVTRNRALFQPNLIQEYRLMQEAGKVYQEHGVGVPHDILGAQALQLAMMRETHRAREILKGLEERYILPDAVEIVGRNCPAVQKATEMVR